MATERITSDAKGKPPIRVLKGKHHQENEMNKWERFDRLQRSLRPLRKGSHPKKGIHYGSE
jgi:hypothetical protein